MAAGRSPRSTASTSSSRATISISPTASSRDGETGRSSRRGCCPSCARSSACRRASRACRSGNSRSTRSPARSSGLPALRTAAINWARTARTCAQRCGRSIIRSRRSSDRCCVWYVYRHIKTGVGRRPAASDGERPTARAIAAGPGGVPARTNIGRLIVRMPASLQGGRTEPPMIIVRVLTAIAKPALVGGALTATAAGGWFAFDHSAPRRATAFQQIQRPGQRLLISEFGDDTDTIVAVDPDDVGAPHARSRRSTTRAATASSRCSPRTARRSPTPRFRRTPRALARTRRRRPRSSTSTAR